MARAKLTVVPTTQSFDELNLSNAELWLLNLSRDLARLRKIEDTKSQLRTIQIAYSENRFAAAVAALAEYFERSGLDLRAGYNVDRFRFSELRKLREVSQRSLAEAVGVTTGAISHFEARNGSLTLVRLLVAAELIRVPPSQFISARKTA
jgi:DNA-binding XRE family transcriptional regulator